MKKALLIIDMLNDFVNPKGKLYCGEESRIIIPYINNLIRSIKHENGVVIFICDSHDENDLEFKQFTPHCIKGSDGARIIDEFYNKGDYIIEKKRFSGFFRTDLEKILIEEKITEVHVVGVCTSICVMDTVSDLKNRDYEVFVHKRGVADFDKEAHEFAIKRMEKVLGAHIV
jgi:nicotinamidase-related amidase